MPTVTGARRMRLSTVLGHDEDMLQARLFGPLTLAIDDRAVPPIAGLKPRSVLAWLLLHPGPHARARLASLFWGEVLDISARASLRNTLWTIRTALEATGGSGYLDADRDRVGIATRLPRQVDTEEFDRLTGLADPAALQEAFALADAPLLADLADDWVLQARDEYRERVAEVALRVAEARDDAGDPRDAASWTRRALAHVPLRESAHRALMRRLAAAGEVAEALAAYERCTAMLSAEFRTIPSDETRALARSLRSARTGTGPPPPAQPPPAQPPSAQPRSPGRAPVRRDLPLAGRERELATLLAAWDQARTGHGGVVLVSGDGGLGKSRLVAELADRVSAERGRCVLGAAFELPAAPPFGLWSDLLHELVAEIPPPPAEAVWPADLARLCRSVESRWGRPASATAAQDPEQERGWLFEAVAETLAWSARDTPLLVVLEDLQLADHASIALLAYAGRRLTRLPVLIVATRRLATSREELAIAIDALIRRHALTAEVVLEPLAAPEMARIVAAAAPGLDRDTQAGVVHAAQGNPLLGREAARAAAEGTDFSHGFRAWVRTPLARLPGSARLLVDAVVVAGRPLERGEAGELIGAEQLPDALDAACREELLDTAGQRIRFVHPLIHEACRAELAPARLTWLHGRLADVLDARSERRLAEIGHHLLLAGRPGEARSYLVSAARHASAMGAFNEAASFLSDAAEAAAGAPDLQAELWLALAETQARRGRRDLHDAAFDRAVALLETAGNHAALAGGYVARGRWLTTALCYPMEALAAYEHALRLMDSHATDTPELRSLALAGLAWVEAASGDVHRAQRLIEQAQALPEAADDAVLNAELLIAHAATLLRTGHVEACAQVSVAAANDARRADRPNLASTALLQAAAAHACRGDFTGALELAEQVRDCWVDRLVTVQALAGRAYALARLGRCDEAWAAVREELALAGRIGAAEHEENAMFDVGSVALDIGRCAEAVEYLAEALSTQQGRFPRALARLRLAEARLRAGDPAAAAAELERVPFEVIGPTDSPETFVPRAERLEGLIAATRGDNGLALRRLEAAGAGWRRLLDLRPVGDYWAASLVDLGRAPVAGLVEPALELGLVLVEQARLLTAVGRAAEAQATEQEAATLAATLGIEGYRSALDDIPLPAWTEI